MSAKTASAAAAPEWYGAFELKRYYQKSMTLGVGIASAFMLLVIGSVSVAYWIRYRFLGQFWSGHIEVQDDHQVIAHGPYAIVRHPLYANTLVIYASVALAFPTWWNWLACAAMVAGYVVWTASEDRFLEENLPGYREYQQQTRYRLLPGIW